MVVPHPPVFVFVVIISTMPVVTLCLAAVLRIERPTGLQAFSIAVVFSMALLVVVEMFQGSSRAVAGVSGWKLVDFAFGVPVLYAGNTLYIISHWPASANAKQVAHAQVVIVSIAALAGATTTGAIGEWVWNNPFAVAGITFFEGLALLVYLKIARDFGPSFLSLANYVSMGFAAFLGAVFSAAN